MSLRKRWKGWLCSWERHDWTRVHAPIWGGGYMRCENCGRRDVFGSDQYGPTAMAWKAWGIEPPASLPGILFTADDWSEWNRQARQNSTKEPRP